MDKVLKTTDWVTCPYDSNHTMKYSKFHNHFVKCKQAHPDDLREQCPYYASELINPEDMKEHLITCKYKTLYPDLYSDSNELPVYEAPCHFNFDKENESDDDSDSETNISFDKTSLFSGTTRRSIKTFSSVSQPIGKLRQNNFSDGKPNPKSYAFEYIEEGDMNDSKGESLYGSRSLSSPVSHIKPFDGKVGLGRGKMIQKLLSASTSSSNSSVGGSGRGDWLRLKMDLD